MTSLKELKILAEAATPGPWRFGANNLNGDMETHISNVHGGDIFRSTMYGNVLADTKFIVATDPATILTLISALEKYEEALKTAREYLSTINDCAKHCDLSSNWHTPDCGMEQSFYQALTQVQKIMEGK